MSILKSVKKLFGFRENAAHGPGFDSGPIASWMSRERLQERDYADAEPASSERQDRMFVLLLTIPLARALSLEDQSKVASWAGIPLPWSEAHDGMFALLFSHVSYETEVEVLREGRGIFEPLAKIPLDRPITDEVRQVIEGMVQPTVDDQTVDMGLPTIPQKYYREPSHFANQLNPSEELQFTICTALFATWAVNEPRRSDLAASPNMKLCDVIGAPIALNDLYAMVRRELGDVSVRQVRDGLDSITIWKQERIAPAGRGSYSYRLLDAGADRRILLRLGEHPTNGIMQIFEGGECPDPQGGLEPYICGTPQNPGNVFRLQGKVPEDMFTHLVLSGLRKSMEMAGEFSTELIAEGLATALESQYQGMTFDDVLIETQRCLSTRCHRLLTLSMQQADWGATAIDIVSLPTGETFLSAWPEDGRRRAFGRFRPGDNEAAYKLLRDFCISLFEGESPGIDFVILGQLLQKSERYPMRSNGFWRWHLGHPFIFESGD